MKYTTTEKDLARGMADAAFYRGHSEEYGTTLAPSERGMVAMLECIQALEATQEDMDGQLWRFVSRLELLHIKIERLEWLVQVLRTDMYVITGNGNYVLPMPGDPPSETDERLMNAMNEYEAILVSAIYDVEECGNG